jgi:putative DNA primase/helicase
MSANESPSSTAGAPESSTRTSTESSALDLSGLLLDTLGYTPDEFVSIGHDTDGQFRTRVGRPTNATTFVATLPEGANIFYGVNPVRGPARRNAGRGTAADVTRLAALWADLDVKPGACASLEVAETIIDELSKMLGTRPSAITHSGNGLHPYWPVDDGTVGSGNVAALLRRWGRLVAVVAEQHGARADSVFDLPRMLRVPGTTNCKASTNGHGGTHVVTNADIGAPLTIAEIDDRLNEFGVYEEPDDARDDEQISSPADWRFAEKTCSYVTKIIDGLGNDGPKPGKSNHMGRHQWACKQAVRLACAYRLGCISENDWHRAQKLLKKGLVELRAASGETVPKYEIPGAFKLGIKRASAKTDEQARAELDNHKHGGDATDAAQFFARDGLQARDLADAVMRTVTCGFGATDERFYVYDNGVWIPNHGCIETEIARLLGNRYRNMHARNALDLIRYSPHAERITCDPLPQWINVRNGMVDWRTGQLQPHTPEHCSTVQLPVEYDPAATCPKFEQFLAQVLPKDCLPTEDDEPGFIWELIGYTLYSGNPLHIAILLYGNGRNGKGTLIKVLKRLLGERNCSTVTLHQLAENRFRAATLFGKLANLAGDIDSRWLENTAMFKAITGGDTIQGEHKYGAAFDFTPWALPFYSTNKAFGSADSSEGWVARWIVVPFPASFVGRENRNLDTTLQTESELRGIALRGIQALPTLIRRGRLPEPESLREAKTAFVAASDVVRSWFEERCILDPYAWTARTDLYRDYVRHADDSGARQLSAREFYNRLAQINNVRPAGRNGTRGFAGVRL